MDNKAGQVMLEAVVALTIMTIGMLGIFGILSSSIGASRVSTDQEIAVNLSAEGIEVVKSIFDKNFFDGGPWNSGLNGCPPAGPGCSVEYDDTDAVGSLQNSFLKFGTVGGIGVYNYSSGTDTIFKRRLSIENVSGNEMRVISTVTWTDKGAISTVVLEDRFFNWR
jgi:hypothetical protein